MKIGTAMSKIERHDRAIARRSIWPPDRYVIIEGNILFDQLLTPNTTSLYCPDVSDLVATDWNWYEKERWFRRNNLFQIEMDLEGK